MSSLPVTMETMYQIVLLFLAAASVTATSTSSLMKTDTEQITGPLRNMEFYNDKLYIGGKDKIHILSMNLDTLPSINTCNGKDSCNNINKVLVIDKNKEVLVACGTGLGGRCDSFNVTSGTYMTAYGENEILQISTDIDRPAQAMITQKGDLVIAITFGTGILVEPYDSSDTYKTYDYALSRRSMPNLKTIEKEVSSNAKSGLNLKINGSPENYVIQYISSFQHNGFSYFVTEQKEYVGANKYVSKLVRLCQNDTTYVSYTDIIIQCEDEDGTKYDIVQNAIITNTKVGKNDQIFIGTFSKAGHPSEWVICSVRLNELNKDIMDAKKNFAYTCAPRENEKRYLPDNREEGACITGDKMYDEKDYLCGATVSYSYVIGNVTANMAVGYKMEQNKGFPTTLHAAFQNNRDLVIMVGTSEGQLKLLNYDNSSSKLDEYSVTDVSPGDQIRAIYSTQDKVYVLSDNKMHLYSSTNCSEFKTCKETIKGRNPLCGWCVFEEKATRKSKCTGSNDPNNWLSSLGDCVKLTVEPAGTKLNTEISINVTASPNILKYRTGDTYDCVFNGSSFRERTNASRNGNVFTCTTPSVNSHDINATLEIVVTPSNVKLAEAHFLFYQCSAFKTCKECVSTEGSKCRWSLTIPKCVESDQNGGIGEEGLCPRLENNTDSNYIPTGVQSAVIMNCSNLPNASLKFWCYVPKNDRIQKEDFKPATVDTNLSTLTCKMNITLIEASKGLDVPIFIKYGNTEQFSTDLTEFEDVYDNKVTVYSCENLGKDCSHCKALKDHYECKWSNMNCTYGSRSVEICPAPKIEKIKPRDGPTKGGTALTIYGSELGTELSDIKGIKIAGVTCKEKSITIDDETRQYFKNEVPSSIVCITGDSGGDRNGPVIVTVNSKDSTETVTFSYKTPDLTGMSPLSGPMAGGTKLTFYGRNLGIGNRDTGIQYVLLGGSVGCNNVKVLPNVGFHVDINKDFTIQCDLQNISDNRVTQLSNIELKIDKAVLNLATIFKLLPNPTIEVFSPRKGTVSGGTGITITGKNLTNANVGRIETTYNGESMVENCIISSPTEMLCKAPEAPKSVKSAITNMINSRRRKRSDCSACIKVQVKVYLDGYNKDFDITYYRDPSLYKFEDKNNVHLFDNDQQKLTIKGAYINLVAKESDVNITIGLESCSVFELRADSITCLAPKDQPSSGRKNVPHPEVNVTIGNYFENVGYLEYVRKTEMLFIILGAVVGGVFALAIIGIIVGCYKYRKVGKRARAIEKNLSDMEMEIKRVAREEFLDMHTTMSSVNKNLVEQGFPYHPYQQFACNVMFSVDYLWTEPVVSNGKMTDDERLKANRGMESLESLIYNKFFLVSVISTMENEKRFFIREKSNLAGNLCAVLMGRMDYLDEILKLLMNNLVQDSPARKHKALFRRCESITEKLLSNWLSLCLYPHVKSHSGSPLYLLYMATQKTMESGPIDAVTGDAKYTLSEEKLLKKWSSSMDEDNDQDLKFEAKTLTLNVVVDNGDEIFKCKVLDCDTISQVKNKCLNQIYVNFPASKLPVGANDLELEWHEGFGGTLKLRDEDNTSKREGKWVRFNTLAHYNVKDESNMALIDPHSADNNLEDYVNLANINMDGVCDGSIDSSQPLTLHDPENPHECEQWHLIKKEEESSKQGKGAITELYLNRLFTTKQSLMEYMRPLFDIILDHDKCPPPTKFLYDYLDELGEKYKVDVETVHAWKSHSYAIRVWASLMKMPNLLFDVSIPSFMDDNLEIISQVFIESFSLSTQKFTKDTPPQKLIFHHERNHYKDRVKEFYKNVKVDPQDSEGFRQYMADVNRLQQATEFNKVSALYRFYKQLKPYFEDIIDNLATNKEASNLQLDRKLEQVIAIMEEDD